MEYKVVVSDEVKATWTHTKRAGERGWADCGWPLKNLNIVKANPTCPECDRIRKLHYPR